MIQLNPPLSVRAWNYLDTKYDEFDDFLNYINIHIGMLQVILSVKNLDFICIGIML